MHRPKFTVGAAAAAVGLALVGLIAACGGGAAPPKSTATTASSATTASAPAAAQTAVASADYAYVFGKEKVAVVDPKTKTPTRVGVREEVIEKDGVAKKVRVRYAKKSGENL